MVNRPFDRAWPRRWLNLCSSHSVPCSSSTCAGAGAADGAADISTSARGTQGAPPAARRRGARVASQPLGCGAAAPRRRASNTHADHGEEEEEEARAPPGRLRDVIRDVSGIPGAWRGEGEARARVGGARGGGRAAARGGCVGGAAAARARARATAPRRARRAPVRRRPGPSRRCGGLLTHGAAARRAARPAARASEASPQAPRRWRVPGGCAAARRGPPTAAGALSRGAAGVGGSRGGIDGGRGPGERRARRRSGRSPCSRCVRVCSSRGAKPAAMHWRRAVTGPDLARARRGAGVESGQAGPRAGGQRLKIFPEI
jgi:hypothetical protein